MSHSQLPLTALRAFEAAARQLSFKSAASSLQVTPTAISHQIQQLERHLGVDLFARVHRGLVLTPAGESCLTHVRNGFTSLRAAIGAVQQPEDSRSLSVSAPPSFAARLLMPLVHDFQAAYPDIELQITSRMRDPVLRADKSPHEADIFGQWAEENDIVIVLGKDGFGNLDAEQLMPLSTELVCSPELARTGALKSIQDVVRFPWLHDDRGLNYGGASFWSQWLTRTGLRLEDRGQGEHYTHASLAIDAAVRGKGLLITTSCLCRNELSKGELISPFQHSVVLDNSYFLLTRRTYRPAVALFKRWLRTAVQEAGLLQEPV